MLLLLTLQADPGVALNSLNTWSCLCQGVALLTPL